jgi:L-malate glycosyltransferase
LGRIIAYFRPLSKEYRVFYFFPFYHTGGAEKIHAQITQAAGGKDCIVFFTRKSENNSFFKDFKKSGCEIRDISKYTDNKWLYFLNLIYRGIITGYINRQVQPPVIFNGQCNFGYKISPWIKKPIRQIELIHSFNSFSYIRTPFLPFISKTVMISKRRIEEYIEFYKKIKTPESYAAKIIHITNAAKIPAEGCKKSAEHFSVLYVGRGGPEKRVHLVAAIAKELNKKDNSVRFEIMGDVSNIIADSDFPYIKFYGNITDEKTIGQVYSNAHLLLITSETEGFPLAIIEAMGYGCVIAATPVGDIPYHVKEHINGHLFSSVVYEEKIITEAVEYIIKLKNNRNHFNTMSENNFAYAKKIFDIEEFNKSYKQLISPAGN